MVRLCRVRASRTRAQTCIRVVHIKLLLLLLLLQVYGTTSMQCNIEAIDKY